MRQSPGASAQHAAEVARRKSTRQVTPSQEGTEALSALVAQLQQMGHGTSIAAQLLELRHSALLTKLTQIKRGELVSIEPVTVQEIDTLRAMLCRLPQTPEGGIALLQRAISQHGNGGIARLKDLSDLLGVSYAVLFRWRSDPPKRIKLDHLMTLQRLMDRGVIS